jgi:hypothetical protein
VIDDEKFMRVKAEAQEELLKIPGVRAVSFGFKHVDGRDTGQPVIVIKVEKKLPPSMVPSNEMIPPFIEGVPTDVKEWKPRADCGPGPVPKPVDTAKERPLIGGTLIQLEFTAAFDSLATSNLNSGTLGFLAKTDGSIAGVPSGGIVGVTCEHVVTDPPSSGNTPVGHDAGQPTAKDCSRCSNCCYDIFGKVLRGIYHNPPDNPDLFLDAAMIAIDSEWKYFADIKQIGPVKDFRVLQKPSDLGTKVQKRGGMTQLTFGTVTDVAEVVQLPGSPIQDGVITIDKDPATPIWDNCVDDFKIIGPGSETFSSFGCKGDSGSAVLDMQSKIVGLLRQVSPDGQGHATGIDAVMRALGIQVETATVAKQARAVPKIAGINAMAGAGQVPVPRVNVPFGLQGTLEKARQELMATPFGQKYGEIVEQHHREVIGLVNKNRRVAAVWHRNGGPQLVGNVLSAVQSRCQPMPTQVDGKPLDQCLLRIQQALMKYGTVGLAADLQQYGPPLLQYIGGSYADLLSSIQNSTTE